MMISLIRSRSRSTVAGVAGPLFALFATGCCCISPSPATTGAGTQTTAVSGTAPAHGEVFFDPSAIPNSTLAPAGNGANPKVYGRARFQGSVVRLDLQVLESSPAQVAKLNLYWVSHVDAMPPLWPYPLIPPMDSYTMNPPRTRWWVLGVPATWNPGGANDCFHIRVDAMDANDHLVISVTQKFTPVLDTEWGNEWVSGG